MTSASLKVTFVSVGTDVTGTAMHSTSYSSDASQVCSYPPPGEVTGLRFLDSETLLWDAERSVGDYSVYRDLVSTLSALGYGVCLQDGVSIGWRLDHNAGGFAASSRW
jgi:hypothetical protein